MRTSEANWELLPDGADSSMRGIGNTKAAAFEPAAFALTAVIADSQLVSAADTIEVAPRYAG